MHILCDGKYWRRKIMVNLANDGQFAKTFPTNTYKYSESTEDLPLDLSSSFAMSIAIRQNFTSSNFFPSK